MRQRQPLGFGTAVMMMTFSEAEDGNYPTPSKHLGENEQQVLFFAATSAAARTVVTRRGAPAVPPSSVRRPEPTSQTAVPVRCELSVAVSCKPGKVASHCNMADYAECRSPRSSGASVPVKAAFSDGFAVATDGCRLSYHLSGDPAATDKVVDPPQTLPACICSSDALAAITKLLRPRFGELCGCSSCISGHALHPSLSTSSADAASPLIRCCW